MFLSIACVLQNEVLLHVVSGMHYFERLRVTVLSSMDVLIKDSHLVFEMNFFFGTFVDQFLLEWF